MGGWKWGFHQVLEGTPTPKRVQVPPLPRDPAFFTSLNKGSHRLEERDVKHCVRAPLDFLGRKQDLLGESLYKHTQIALNNSMKAEAVKPCKV